MGGVVGGEQSYAGFLYQPRGPGYVARKRGALEQDQAELFTYMQFGSQSEVDPECTISAGDAWEALRRYFETGKRPETIEWGP
jgi:hypothetical protein